MLSVTYAGNNLNYKIMKIAVKESNRRYYLKNKDKILINNKKWHKNNPDKVKEYNLKSRLKYSLTPKSYFKVLSRNARKRNLDYLNQKDFLNWYGLQLKKCVYCGILEEQLRFISVSFKNKEIKRLTIDRKDNNVGYLTDNMVLCCFRCNSTKSDFFTFDEMLNIGKKFIRPKYKCND